MTNWRIEAEKAIAEATPGPWVAVEILHFGEPGTGFTHGIYGPDRQPVEELGGMSWQDGKFCAIARTALPLALTELREQHYYFVPPNKRSEYV